MNGTFLSTETFAQYQDSTERLQCRICLEEIQEDYKPPPYCECRGNHSSVHEECLREWARRTQKFRDGRGNAYFNCDLCRTPIYMRIQRICRRKSGKECCQEFQQNYCKIGLIIIMLIFFAGVFVISLWGMLYNDTDRNIYMSMAVISGIMMAFAIMALVSRLAVAFREVVGGFIPLEQIRKRSNSIANSFMQDAV